MDKTEVAEIHQLPDPGVAYLRKETGAGLRDGLEVDPNP